MKWLDLFTNSYGGDLGYFTSWTMLKCLKINQTFFFFFWGGGGGGGGGGGQRLEGGEGGGGAFLYNEKSSLCGDQQHRPIFELMLLNIHRSLMNNDTCSCRVMC